jgi:SUMO ligase MMS21 Smc5/6 complex component
MLSQRHDGEAAVGVRIQAMLRNEKEYTTGLKDNNDGLVSMASTVAHDGPLASLLDHSKLQEYRDTIKRLALQNVAHHRQVEAYLQGLRNLQSVTTSQEDEVVDYSKMLKESMNTAFTQMEKENVRPEQDPVYTTVSNNLNEPQPGEGQQDDEIAVMQGGGARTSLKCPITGVLMENPWKNKVCGHVYEQHAILNHLKKDRLKRCPVAGCGNKEITQAQLVEDRNTLTLIRRQKIRDQKQREIEKQSQNAIEMDESDDE